MQPKGIFVFIDDDEDEHALFTYAMNKLGIDNRIEFFTDGKEAFKFLLDNELRIFMIFSDIHMPEMSGLDLKKNIDEVPILRAKSIPFVFHSSSSSPSDVKRAYGLNIQGFFQKTSDIDEAALMLKTAIDYWARCILPTDVNKL